MGLDLEYLKKLDQAVAADAATQGGEINPAGADASNGPQTPPQEDLTLGGAFLDTGKAIAGGIESVGRGATQALTYGANAVMRGLTPPGLKDYAPQIPDITEGVEPLVPEPEYAVNKLAKGAIDFGLAIAFGNKVNAMAKVGSTLVPAAKTLVDQFAGSMLTRDAHQEHLSDFLDTVPAVRGPVTHFLQSDDHDSIALSKFKHALEDQLGIAGGEVAFKSVMLGFKTGTAVWKSAFGKKSSEEVAAELDKEIAALNEKPPSNEKYPEMVAAEGNGKASPESSINGAVAEKHLTLDPNAKGPNDLFDKSPSFNKKTGQDGSDLQQIKIDELDWRSADHIGDVDPKKVASLREQLRKDPSKVPTISVEEMQDGKRFIMDGRHRIQAAKEEGFTHVTGKVYETKETAQLRTEAQAKKLTELEAQAGGEKQLERLAAKAEESRGAFQPNLEQMQAFKKALESDLTEAEQLPYLKQVFSGAINLTKVQTREDVFYTLDQMVKATADTVRKTGTKDKQTWEQIEAAARLFNIKPQYVVESLRSWGVDAANIPAMVKLARTWQASLADQVARDAVSVAGGGVAGDTAMVSALSKIQTLHELTALLSTIKKSTARTLNSLKIVVKPQYSRQEMQDIIDAAGGDSRVKTLMDKLAMAQGDPKKTADLLKVSWMSKVIDTHNELWINALLSSPKTHIINMSTASMQLFMKPAMRSLGGAIVGDFEKTRDAIALWRAMRTHFHDSWTMANRAFDVERPLLSITDKQLEINPTISAANYGFDEAGMLGKGANRLGKVTRLTSRFLGAEDEFFKQISYRAYVQMQAEKEAMDLVRAGKLSLDKKVFRNIDGQGRQISEYDAWVQDKFAKAFEYEEIPEAMAKVNAKGKPTSKHYDRSVMGEEGARNAEGKQMRQRRGLDEEALQYSAETTFTQSLKAPVHYSDGRNFGEYFYDIANSMPAFRGTMLPFVKVPTNLFREGVSYTPGLNLLSKKFQQDLVAGGNRAAEARGKLALSSFFGMTGMYMAMNGMITGAAPTDPDIRARMYDKNWKPYSFVLHDPFTGEKRYIPFNRMDPYGIPYGIIADIAQTIQHLPKADGMQLVAASTLAMANLLDSKGYLKGVADTIDILHGGGAKNINEAEKIIQGYIASHVPNILRVGETSQELKDVRSVADALLARVPFFSDKVERKYGYFGDKVMAPVGWPWNWLLPTDPTVESKDPALLELARLADGPSAARFAGPKDMIGPYDLHEVKDKQGKSAYVHMMELLNEGGFHEAVNQLVAEGSPYHDGTDGDGFHRIGSKVVELKKLEHKYHKKALDEMLDHPDFADLKDKIREWEKDDRRVKRGRQAENPIEQLLEVNQ